MDGLMNTMLQQLAGTVGGAQPQQLAHVARLLQGKKMICTTGAGRTGLVMRMLAMRLAQMGLPVQVAGDVTCGPVGAGCVLVVGSGSGETGGLVRQAQKAKQAGAKLAVLTTAPESTLAAMADAAAVVPAPRKRRRAALCCHGQPVRRGASSGLRLAGGISDGAVRRHRSRYEGAPRKPGVRRAPRPCTAPNGAGHIKKPL